jgi:hypothetical protein
MPQLPSDRKFVRRKNPDGRFDSICAKCFGTIAKRGIEPELEQAEHAQLCFSEDVEPAEKWLSELPGKGVQKVVEFPPRCGRKAG